MEEGMGIKVFNTDTPQMEDDNAIVLTSRPISIHRRVFFKLGPGGIPILKEVIFIETEASMGRIGMILLKIFIYALIFQILFSLWERYHNKSCKIVTTVLLFAFPPLLAIFVGDFVFFITCFLFLSLLAKTFYNIVKKPMRSDVPKKTYKIFRALYRTTSLGSIVGQTVLIIGFFSNVTFAIMAGLFMLLTSLYFGLLTREAIEISTEKMAINLGYYSKDGAPEKKIKNNVCAICDESVNTKSIVLNCKHAFHVECIQGWVFMGKKGFCPCCRENVNFDKFDLDTWQKGENIYSVLIDFMRKGIIFLAFFIFFGVLNRFKS